MRYGYANTVIRLRCDTVKTGHLNDLKYFIVQNLQTITIPTIIEVSSCGVDGQAELHDDLFDCFNRQILVIKMREAFTML